MADPSPVASPPASTTISSSSAPKLHGHGHALRVDEHGLNPDTHSSPKYTIEELKSAGTVVQGAHLFDKGTLVEGRRSTPVIVGVAGASGSGKTSIAELIAARLVDQSVLAISSDNYYISVTEDENPAEHNFDHPASIDFDLLADHLAKLRAGETVGVPHYDFHTHKRTGEVTNISGASTDVIIVDGIFVLWAEGVRKQCDLTIFCSEDLDICLARRLARDIEKRGRTPASVIQQYIKFVKPGFHAFVAPSMQFADIIVPRARDNVVAITMLAKEVQRRVLYGV